jgi:DNA topoisomerase-1
MAKNLVIVESPAKAKTIARYLGSDYEVKSSFGHIRDLPKKGLNIDIEHNFKPTYEISEDKAKIVRELKKASKGKVVWLASDEDREGEAIAWHLTKALDIDSATTKRIVFHEITKPAIESAIEHPRLIDKKLVDAQQARRILDRLVGYELSPVLWKKIQSGLSAGRVQSVAVRIIVDREREIKAFESSESFKVVGQFKSSSHSFKAELDKKLESLKKSEEWFGGLKGAVYTVKDIAQKPAFRNPGAPFTTSTLQQEASRRLGFSVRQTMTLAQRLYENGDITYMRTDSTVMSGLALDAAEKYITSKYGSEYTHKRQYATKSKSAQEAHEAIRPTDFSKERVNNGDEQQHRLYRLIWEKALASQMSQAKLDRTEAVIGISNKSESFIAKGEVVKFDGFTKVYGKALEDSILPELKVGDKVTEEEITAEQSFTKSPARFSEAALVKRMEELGIGRPSTYAPTISTIQSRGYVEKKDLEGVEKVITILVYKNGKVSPTTKSIIQGADRQKLIPTPLAELTTDFLVKYFKPIVDYDFTAKVESDFDDIEDGGIEWQKMIKDFYKDFHPLVDKSADVSRKEIAKARLLGKDPKSGEPIYARFGRFGPVLQRGEADEEKDIKPTFAPLPEGVSLDDVTLEQALKMLTLPREVGKTDKGEIIEANIGRFGPYIKVDKTFVSIKPVDPLKITEKEAKELYAQHLKKIADKNIQEFDSGIKVLNGPYGPYVTNGKKNVRLAKSINPKKLTEAEAKKLIDEAPDKKRSFRRRPRKNSNQ